MALVEIKIALLVLTYLHREQLHVINYQLFGRKGTKFITKGILINTMIPAHETHQNL